MTLIELFKPLLSNFFQKTKVGDFTLPKFLDQGRDLFKTQLNIKYGAFGENRWRGFSH